MLDIFVQSRRNTKTARRFRRKLLRDPQDAQRVTAADKLKSYGAPMRQILLHVVYRQSK